MRNLILCVLFALCFVERPRGCYGWRPRVAIVGGGIGGSTTAYFLRQALGDELEITIYEKDLGFGRVATVKVGEKYYESGGAVLHPGNQYMANLTRTFGLKRAKDFPIDTTFGFFDGSDIVFQTQRNLDEKQNNGLLFLRYGEDLMRGSWINDLVKSYEKIYHAQKGDRAFETVHDMFNFMIPDFEGLMTSTIGDYMKHLGYGKEYINDFAKAAMRINYGQNLDIQGFVGAISLAGVQGGLWSVEGGNYLVAEHASEQSKAQRKQSRVTKLKESTSGGRKHFLLTHESTTSYKKTEQFDAVVLALPCNTTGCGGIEFSVSGIEDELSRFPKSYQRTVANFVKGKLNPKYFKSTDDELPDSIWSVAEGFQRDDIYFKSIDRQIPVDYGTKPESDPQQVSDLDVYKIFTSTPMTLSQVEKLFQSHSEFKQVDWKAYPKYDQVPTDARESAIKRQAVNRAQSEGKHCKSGDLQTSLPSFILDSAGGLISVNAIESSASAIEQSIVGAKNAAIIVAKYLKSREKPRNYLSAVFGWQDFSQKPCEPIENSVLRKICLSEHGDAAKEGGPL